MQLTLSAGGGLAIEAAAEPSGGALPGLKDIDIPIAGSVPFDGLLLDAAESAEASADLPETTLPEIPLGSIPGSLVLTVVKGSKLTSKFHATCLSVAGGTASYAGETKTGGTLVLKGKIVLKLPARLNKSIDLPEITVPIPEVTTAADAAPLTVSGIADATQGACNASAGGSKPGAGSAGGASNGSGAGNGSGSSDPGTGSGSGGSSDPGAGGRAPDAGAPPDSGTTPPPACVDSDDASGNELSGKAFSTTDGIDTATTVHGIMNCASDVDWYRVSVSDTSFALLQPNIQNATSGTQLCAFVKCGGGSTTVSCSAGSAATSDLGEAGCCVSGAGAVKPSWNCSGTLNDSATVSLRVKNTGANACLPYSFSYVF